MTIVDHLSDKMADGCYSDEESQMVDLFTDIMLWAHKNGKDYNAAIRSARNHAIAEIMENNK